MTLLDGFFSMSLWGYVGYALLVTHITIASVTIYLHRHQAHRALTLHPLCSHFFRLWLWLTTGMSTREWVAIHRKHHAKVDAEEDPHSPQRYGIKKVLFTGAELYQQEINNKETIAVYGHGTPDDWVERKIYCYTNLGPVFMLAINIALFGFIGVTIWAVQMLWIPFFAAGVINGIGHFWGYRNFEVSDASTNILPFGILIGGEEMHNNHHAFANSAKLSYKWWEFDIGWAYICILRMLGLASVKKLAPKPIVNLNKVHIDYDTVCAVITNRLHVMADYGDWVIQAIYKQELAEASSTNKAFYKRGHRSLYQDDTLLDIKARQQLVSLLEHSNKLSIAYDFRQRLQQLWTEKMASKERLVLILQEWCKQAESTGIQVLQDFSNQLRSYTLQAA